MFALSFSRLFALLFALSLFSLYVRTVSIVERFGVENKRILFENILDSLHSMGSY